MTFAEYVAIIIHDYSNTTVPRLYCAYTRLCPYMTMPRHTRAPTRIEARHDLPVDNYIATCVHKLCVNLNCENTSIPNYCWRNEEKCDRLTIVQLSPTVRNPSEILWNFIFPIKNIAALVWLCMSCSSIPSEIFHNYILTRCRPLKGTTMHPRCRHIGACWDLLECWFQLFSTSQNTSQIQFQTFLKIKSTFLVPML